SRKRPSLLLGKLLPRSASESPTALSSAGVTVGEVHTVVAIHLHHRFHGPHVDYIGVGVAAAASWIGLAGVGEAALIAAGIAAARGAGRRHRDRGADRAGRRCRPHRGGPLAVEAAPPLGTSARRSCSRARNSSGSSCRWARRLRATTAPVAATPAIPATPMSF